MSSEFLIVVVIYEINIGESLTIQRLIKLQEELGEVPEILVYDNSLISKHDEKYDKLIKYYKHDSSNGGVASAYNYALSLAGAVKKDWLILFDQDTDVNNKYFKELMMSMDKFPDTKLFCPTVQANNRIISPARYIAERAFVFNKPKRGLLKSRLFTVINSGLVIQAREMESLGGFTNKLPLDFSDHYFFTKYKRRNKNFVVINCVNLHGLSSNEDRVYEVVYRRFKIYCKSAFAYSIIIKSLFPLIWLTIRTLKLTFKFSKFEFFTFLLFRK
jgi:hypothetical protein